MKMKTHRAFTRRDPSATDFPSSSLTTYIFQDGKLSPHSRTFPGKTFSRLDIESMKSLLIRKVSNGKRGCFPENWINFFHFFSFV
jgi:hypothetical protein